MYDKALIVISIIILIVSIILFFRGRSNRSGTQDDIDSVDELKNGTTAASGIIGELEGNTSAGQDLTGDITANNDSAREGIDEAIRILTDAKKPNNTDKDI